MQRGAHIVYISLARLPSGRAHGYAIMKMCERFSTLGASVKLIVPAKSSGILLSDPFEYYKIARNFEIVRLRGSDLLARFANSRLAFAIDQMTFIVSLLKKKFESEIVYTRDYQIVNYVRAKNIIFEIHSIPGNTRAFMRAVRRARKVVVISRGLENELLSRKVPKEKILVASDAVDLAEFNIRPNRESWRALRVDPQKKIVLYAGHFYGWKGAETLAKASAHLSSAEEIVLMGGVDEELAMFKKEYSRPNVHIIGYQSRGVLASYLMTADLLILPNSGRSKISSHYTSPLKLFQYMASGVPIVASDLPSIREILTNENAFWFTPDDEHSLAKQIEFVLSQPEMAHMKAARAKDDVKKYTWDARARAILEFMR